MCSLMLYMRELVAQKVPCFPQKANRDKEVNNKIYTLVKESRGLL